MPSAAPRLAAKAISAKPAYKSCPESSTQRAVTQGTAARTSRGPGFSVTGRLASWEMSSPSVFSSKVRLAPWAMVGPSEALIADVGAKPASLMAIRTFSGVKGFVRRNLAPAPVALARISGVLSEVTKPRGVFMPWLRIVCSSSKPPMLGIFQSESTKSGENDDKTLRASWPSPASSTRSKAKPACRRVRRTSWRITRLSSTSRTFMNTSWGPLRPAVHAVEALVGAEPRAGSRPFRSGRAAACR